jgi:hypothetical protein
VAIDERESSEPIRNFKEFSETLSDDSNRSENKPTIIRDIPWNVPYLMLEWSPPKKKNAFNILQSGFNENGKCEGFNVFANEFQQKITPSNE